MKGQVSHEIREQAAGWFIRFRREELSVSARDDFLRWLHLSPHHVQAYLEEALSHSDEFPPTTCKQLTGRPEEPCRTGLPEDPCKHTQP